MDTLDINTIGIIVGAAVALVLVLYLLLRRKPSVDGGAGHAEGHDVADSAAAAIEDMLGEMLGVDAHPAVTPPPVIVPPPIVPTTTPPKPALKPASQPAARPAVVAPAAPTAPATAPAIAPPVPSVAIPSDAAPVADAPVADADVLTTLKGLGPKAAALLNGLGIVRFAQLAALDGARLTAVDDQMGAFKGRIHRDRWVEQARLLAAGDTAGFESEFGKLG